MKMIHILIFDKPKRAQKEFAGKYVPNMSKKSMDEWKAKHISGDDERIEIRKTISGFDPIIEQNRMKRGWGSSYNKANSKEYTNCSAQILLIVRKDGSIVMSANGRMALNYDTWIEMNLAVEEAKMILNGEN